MTPLLIFWPSAKTYILKSKLTHVLNSELGLADLVMMDDCSDVAKSLDKAYRKLIPVTAIDTTLHLLAIVPLGESGAAAAVRDLAAKCAASQNRTTLHVITLGASLGELYDTPASEQTLTLQKEALREIAQMQADTSLPNFSVTSVDDFVRSGAPANFNYDSFSRWLGMLVYALVSAYYKILPAPLTGNRDARQLSMGISSVGFNRAAATEFLLRRAFIDALNGAGVGTEDVNIQVAKTAANNRLEGLDKRYSRFLENKIIKYFKDSGRTADEVVADKAKELEAEMQDIEDSVRSLIDDPKLSLLEKETVLAMIIGRDNEHLRGIQYDTESRLIDDVSSEAVMTYIDAFNKYAADSGLLPLRGAFPGLKKFEYDENEKKMVESSENKEAFYPLPDLKKLKKRILDHTSFIRQKADQLRQLEQAESERSNAEAKISDNPAGKRPVVKGEIKEQPLEETYTPASGLKPAASVDLRNFFSPVKDQKRLGACSTFAVVSMYEAIMNRFSADSAGKADMSERFLYYHTNVLEGRPEGGSNYFDQLAALGKYGICSESLCPSIDAVTTEEPTPAATEDAANHRVLQAKEIKLVKTENKAADLKENHRLITSALSEGYPVGIALKLYENFGETPFVSRPTDEEIAAGEEEFHAMVIAGYSEADKFYIVRNSWGIDFGENGYCYISQAYIDDPELNLFSCIITDTTDSHERKGREVPQTLAGFAATETQISMAVIRNILDMSRIELESDKKEYEETYKYYQLLLNTLGMPNNRNGIRMAAEIAATEKVIGLTKRYNELANNFAIEMKRAKRDYIMLWLKLSAGALLVDISAGTCLLNAYNNGWAWLLYIIAGIYTLVCVIGWINYASFKRRKRNDLQESLDRTNIRKARAERELQELQLRFHIAGMWVDNFSKMQLNLSKLYSRIVSYNQNLRTWKAEDEREIVRTIPPSGNMNIPLEDEQVLIDFYGKCRGRICENLNLLSAFKDYSINSEIIADVREKLRKATSEVIDREFSEFRVIDHLLDSSRYDFAKKQSLDEMFATMQLAGQPTWRNSDPDLDEPLSIMVMSYRDSDIDGWHGNTSRYFAMRPELIVSSDNDRMVLITIQPMPI